MTDTDLREKVDQGGENGLIYLFIVILICVGIPVAAAILGN